MGKRLAIYLDESLYCKLTEMARDQRRTPEQQALWILQNKTRGNHQITAKSRKNAEVAVLATSETENQDPHTPRVGIFTSQERLDAIRSRLQAHGVAAQLLDDTQVAHAVDDLIACAYAAGFDDARQVVQ